VLSVLREHLSLLQLVGRHGAAESYVDRHQETATAPIAEQTLHVQPR
jgi:hypothetical protein